MSARPYLPLLICIALALPLITTGCSINVDKKGKNGEDKRVKIDTPLGNIHVNTDRAPGATGIALYPGAMAVPDHDGDKDADVRLGFGPWQLRVQVEHYSTADDRDKVLSYYRRSLARFGNVIECRGNEPVGATTRTAEGLTCAEDEDKNHHVDLGDHDLSLRAGSKRHQHIVAIDKESMESVSGPTKFTLVALDLPGGTWKKDSETD
ncbi:MAG: hypothetical protein JWM54_2370 [Acidobacteriaceae bacterium]|jgi:hypothetical protein|nr:hypothetical protein [Acidobacteriaceae bacterium]